METQRTLTILNALANGVHPATGEQFPADSPYQHPDVVRALFAAMRAMDRSAAPAGSEAKTATAPGKVGSRWTPEEEHDLAKAFDAGTTVNELARTHSRSIAAIEARLLKLGKIDASQVTSPLRYPPKPVQSARAGS